VNTRRSALVMAMSVSMAMALGAGAGQLARADSGPGGGIVVQPPPTDGNGTTVADAGNCVIYHSAAHFGKDCTDGGVAGAPVRSLYPHGTTDFDVCLWTRADPETEDLYQANPAYPHPGHAWVETCLTGVDPDISAFRQTHLQETAKTVWVPLADEATVTTPPPGQPALWHALVGQYPDPVLTFGPATDPRVNIPTYASLDPTTQRSAKIGVVGVDTPQGNDQNVTMWAEVSGIDVQPGPTASFTAVGMPSASVDRDGAGNPISVQCSGEVAWQDGWTAAALTQPAPGACAYSYLAGSVNLTDQAYSVVVTATYVVHYTVGGGPVQTMNGAVTRTKITQVPVDEIQTLNR
jgi:hypothetical protein